MGLRLRTSNPINAQHPRNRGLYARYKCLAHLSGGPTWWDIGPSGFHAPFQSPASSGCGWRPPSRPGGQGEILFANPSFCALPPSSFFTLKNNFTICAWAYSVTTNGNFQAIWSQTSGFCQLMTVGATGFFYCENLPANTSQIVDSTDHTGAWHRFGFSASSASGTAIYVDGKLAKSEPGQTADATLAPQYAIGSAGGVNFPFAGRIDDVGFFSRAWSPAEFEADYLDTKSDFDPTLNWHY
jgi:concanavalin A-like lectin/glucanase superfamily protein